MTVNNRVCLVNARQTDKMTLKGQGPNLTLGQGHVVTQIDHVAYQ